MCPANLCNILPPHPPPPIFPELSTRLGRSYFSSFPHPARHTEERIGGNGGDGGDCEVGSLSASRRLLASCYFCVPVNRVWNPICLFATASILHPHSSVHVIPLRPSHPRSFYDRCRSVCSSRVHLLVHIYTRTRT